MSITDYPEVLDAINAILKKRGVAEVKLEGRDEKQKIVVVETSRQVRYYTPAKH